jgi:hypothetical protein
LSIPKVIELEIRSRAEGEVVLDEAEWISDEINAYQELSSNYSEEQLKQSSYGSQSYQDQLRFLKEKSECVELSKSIKTPEHLELLLDIENIIGSHCRNKNSRSWKKEFRYRPTFIADGEEYKPNYTGKCSLIPIEQLLMGKYKFGANELMIFEALSEVIELLESQYGLTFPKNKI